MRYKNKNALQSSALCWRLFPPGLVEPHRQKTDDVTNAKACEELPWHIEFGD